jgi:hypothetical protein
MFYENVTPSPIRHLGAPREFFDQMVETQVAMGLAEYKHADPFHKDLPTGFFLLIPPCPAKLDLDRLISLIKVNGEAGINLLDAEHISDMFDVPEEPYLLLDIREGKYGSNMKPRVAERNILAEHRSPYTLSEGIVHAIVFPKMLEKCNVDLCGSRYGGSELVTVLHLSGGHPMLAARWIGSGGGAGWGAPSCGGRQGA